MKIKNLVGIGIAVCLLFTGCGQKEQMSSGETAGGSAENAAEKEAAQNMPETESVRATESETESETESGENTADNAAENWQAAYLKYLEDSGETAEGCTYSLIYVDEDEIPELVIDTGYEAGGCQILTYHEGTVDMLQTARLYFDYVEKGNLLCNSEGHMGYYYDYVFTIEDGKWGCIGEGEYGDGENGVQFDENGDFIFVYRWEGETVEEQEYNRRLKEIYDKEQAVAPQKYYNLTEICSILETGEVSSAKHRYELVTEDITWEEAQKKCKEKGGYLATISSVEEFQRIEQQIVDEKKTKMTFWVGGKHLEEEGLWGYYWLEQGENRTAYSMLDLYNAYRGFWLEGEPSYRGVTESGEEVEERYVVLFFRSSDGRGYLNDVPDDILAAAPSYAGRVGYICEYDD